MADLGDLAIPATEALLVADDRPVGDRLVARIAELRLQSAHAHRTLSQLNHFLAIAFQLESLGRVTDLGIVQLHAVVGLVFSVGDRQHDAMPLRVDVDTIERLAIQLVEQHLGLRIHDAADRARVDAPAVERRGHERIDVEWPAHLGHAPGGHHGVAARSDPGHEHRCDDGAPREESIRHVVASRSGRRASASRCLSR